MANGYKLTGKNTILDVVKKAQDAEAYRDSVNTEYRKLINLLTVPPTEVYKEHKKMVGDVKEAELDVFHNLDPTKNLKEEKSILDVFQEKSKDADEMLNQEEMIKFAIDTAIGSTPVGAVSKGGKGVMSFLKNLIGKIQSKYKFPVGQGKPTDKVVSNAMKELVENYQQSQSLKNLPTKPKGMRQVGKFNRQKWEK